MDHWMDDFAGSVFTCARVHIAVCFVGASLSEVVYHVVRPGDVFFLNP